MAVTIGMNYGHQRNVNLSTYDSSQVDLDLAYLKRIGFTKLRIAMPPYDSSRTRTNVQDVVKRAVDSGFYTICGVTSGYGHGTITSARWNAHNDYVLNTFAPWCQANGVDELNLDNEVEIQLSSQVTIEQAIDDICLLASNVKSGGFTGKVSYASSYGAAKLVPWIANGTGDLDYLSFNIYGSVGFQESCYNVSRAFGLKTYISEFGCISSGYADYDEETAWYNDVVDRIAAMQQELQYKLAYFFCFRDGGFGLTADTFALMRSDGFEHLVMNALLGDAVTSSAVTISDATRRS